MKKLIVLAAVAMVAGLTHGASVKWNSGTNSNGFKSPTGENLKNSTLYTFVVTFYSYDSDTSAYTEVGQASATTAGATGAYSGTYSAYNFTAGETYYATAIITSNDGKFKKETEGYSAFTIPSDDSAASINFTSGAGFASTGSKYSSAGWQSVPEPTSGLLMLLGVAGLALRRRRI